ncbi:MAG: hypothetical protein J5605_02110 [Bacteroidales bacterium]|nr:hypothetical protein [Bacteroidales bacterium]
MCPIYRFLSLSGEYCVGLREMLVAENSQYAENGLGSEANPKNMEGADN